MNAWMAAGTAIIVIVPVLLLAIASIRYGVDSRPGISEREQEERDDDDDRRSRGHPSVHLIPSFPVHFDLE